MFMKAIGRFVTHIMNQYYELSSVLCCVFIVIVNIIQNDQKHGLGVLTFVNGDVFRGYFVNDSMEYGEILFSSSNERYQGVRL
jgi:hypothetical protein